MSQLNDLNKKNNRSDYSQRTENKSSYVPRQINKEDRVVSAGFVVRSQDGKYLIGKTTKFPKAQCWTVFKGQQEEGESLIATATRELREEAGIDILKNTKLQLSQSTSRFFSFTMKEKDVILFLLNDEHGVLNEHEFKCSSYWGPSKTPEICEYKWVSLDEMEENIFPSQRGLVEYLRSTKF